MDIDIDNQSNVKMINKFIKEHAWFDFYVSEYTGNKLTILGGIDLSMFHQIEIHFEGVFCYQGKFDWKTDTDILSLDIPQGSEKINLNIKYNVEVGYSLFRFRDEDSDLPIIIAAGKCSSIIKDVYYG